MTLMVRDLDSILHRLEADPAPAVDSKRIRETIESIKYHIDHLCTDLPLELSLPISPAHHARAVAATWLSRIPDLGPETLARYGPEVPVATAERLRRLLMPLQHEFERLLRGAS